MAEAPCPSEDFNLIDTLFIFTCGVFVMQMQIGFGFLEAGTISANSVTHVRLLVFDISSRIKIFAHALCRFFTKTFAMCSWAQWPIMQRATLSLMAPMNRLSSAIMDFFLTTSIPATTWATSLLTPLQPLQQVTKLLISSGGLQMTCPAAILSGSMAGRASVYSYVLYSLVITGLVYPVVVYWSWSDNAWLADGVNNAVGYRDFAGSGVVHTTGGMAGLIGSIMLGPRKERVRNGKLITLRPHSVPFATLGGFLLVVGFFAFNVGSLLSISAADGSGIAAAGRVVINTTLAISGGGLTAMILEKFLNGELSLMITINGMLAGAVAVCASANNIEPWASYLVGIIGGFVFLVWSKVLPSFGVDDSIDAVPVHLGAGLWGIIAEGFFARDVGLFYDNSQDAFDHFGWQLFSGFIIVLWSGSFSVFMFYPLKALGRLRISESTELQGIDLVEHDEGAYFTGDNLGEEHQDAFVMAMRSLKRTGSGHGSSSTAYSNAIV
eukprot:TRINITY_DN8093_c0_g1_i1.p1 TRINITY_DN8093_c0_g1~~TRINITY_DN8093_c0_g1_i1.p1  ORF type:complete len:536 (+),score=50.42 TRINITY_DN8093_c0_g1_i1:126-1610(+)